MFVACQARQERLEHDEPVVGRPCRECDHRPGVGAWAGPSSGAPGPPGRWSRLSSRTHPPLRPAPRHDHIPGFLVHGGRCPSDGRPLGGEPRPEAVSGEHPTVRRVPLRATAPSDALQQRHGLGSGKPGAPIDAASARNCSLRGGQDQRPDPAAQLPPDHGHNRVSNPLSRT